MAQESLPSIIKKIQPSTVLIVTYDSKGDPLAQGSGFIISQNGEIITNRHVIEDAYKADVKTSDGKIYKVADILSVDSEGDIVRLSLNGVKSKIFSPLTLSNSVPQVGEKILVIGNPLGLEQTVSDGIVSAVRDIPAFGNIIQITAPISPGSSGGPVINMKGEVLGIATFQYIEGQNLNFAVPADRIDKLVVNQGSTLANWSIGNEGNLPSSYDNLYRAGLSFVWAAEYEKAIPYFERAVKKNPNYADAHFRIGYCYAMLGRYQECIEANKQAIRIKPDYANAHCNLGLAYGEVGRYKEGIEALKQAIRINPDDVDFHFNLGWVYFNSGNYQESVESYKQALRIKPDDASVYCNLGISYEKLAKYKEAIESYKQAIRIEPDDFMAHSSLGSAYSQVGRTQEGIEAYKMAIKIKPDYFIAYFNLGRTYEKLGKYEEAKESYKQAIKIEPGEAHAHYYLGCVYLAIGDKGSALNEYKVLKELDLEQANKLFNLIYK